MPPSPRIFPRAALVLTLLCLAFVPQSSWAQDADKELIAVLDIDAIGANDVERAAITDRLREVILKTGRFTVVDRSQMDAILDEQALQQTGCTAQECAVQVGQILGVRKIVSGKVVKFSDSMWQISALMLDVETAETLKADSVRHQGDIFSLLDNQVPALGRKLALGVTAAAVLVAPVDKAPAITEFAGEWTPMSPLSEGRADHASAVLNNRIYVFGGVSADYKPLASVEIFEPATNKVQAGPPLPEPRAGATAAALGGRLYVIGGRAGKKVLERVDILDPAGAIWSPGPKLPSARSSAMSAVLKGKLYVLGGISGDDDFLDEVLVLKADGSGWEPVEPMQRPRAHSTVAVHNDKLWVFGGESDSSGLFSMDVSVKYVESYDPEHNRWTSLKKMPRARSYITSAVIQGQIYVFGGVLGNIVNLSTYGEYHVYDPAKDAWGESGSMDRARAGHSTDIANGRIYFIGGRPNQWRQITELR